MARSFRRPNRVCVAGVTAARRRSGNERCAERRRTYYAGLDRLNGKPYATLICTHAQTTEEILRPKHISEQNLKLCEELGATLASGIALGIF